MRRYIFTLVIAFSSFLAKADDAAIQETSKRVGISVEELKDYLNNCEDTINQPTANICAEYRFVEQENHMNTAFDKFLKSQKSDRLKTEIKKDQEMWLKYRKQNCKEESSEYEGGSIQPMIELNCMTTDSSFREKELNRFIEDGFSSSK